MAEVSSEFNEIYRALSLDARLDDSWNAALSNRSIFYRFLIASVLHLSHQAFGFQVLSMQRAQVRSFILMWVPFLVRLAVSL